MERVLRIALAVVIFCGFLRADTYTERWLLSAGGIASGENSFSDKEPGPDRLPYTADDVAVPANGNEGGTWSFGFLDTDSDGEDEHAFAVVRREDDDMLTLSTWSDFAHGVIAEGEMWVDAHHARHEGPAQADPDDDDFEWNDRPGWESESNWFWYNNIRANQRGLGGSIYYFEYRDPILWQDDPFDEVQGWTWTISLKNNAGAEIEVEGYWGEATDLQAKGLFIPVAAIPDLKNGELDELFGWQEIDMAEYVRDTLYPKLLDPNLTVFLGSEASNACQTAAALPPTFVMISQVEATVMLTDPVKAEYWGVTMDEEATFRWSSIYLKGDGPDNPAIDLVPEDDRYLNLWRRDGFVRKNTGNWGDLEIALCPGQCWEFVADGVEDCQNDGALRLPAASGPEDTYFALPVGRDLDGVDGAIVGRASVALENPFIEGNRVELILCQENDPVAWLILQSGEKPRLGIGGGNLADNLGSVGDALEEAEGPAEILLKQEGDGYSELELLFAPQDKRLEFRIDGELEHSFTYTGTIGSVVNKLWFYAEAADDETGVSVDEVSVLQEFSLEVEEGPFFRRGDSNRDGAVNIADAVYVLQNLFASGPAILCPDAADSNDDESVNIADAVYVLQNLFASGPAIPPPHPACGVDTTGVPDTAPPGTPELGPCDYCPGACQDLPEPCGEAH